MKGLKSICLNRSDSRANQHFFINYGDEVLTTYFLGVDIGTSRVKAIITDVYGKIVTSYYVNNDVKLLKPGWAEQDPEYNWWVKSIDAIRGCLKVSRIDPEDIKAISLSGLSVNLAPIGKSGDLIRPAIIYMDSRSVGEVEWMKREIGNELFLRINGNPISHRMLAPKILWFMRNEPRNYDRTWKIIVSSHGYVIYKLCGNIVADHYVADMTGLSDYRAGEWSDELCDLLGIDREKLPTTVSPRSIVGYISKEAANKTGLKRGTPIVAGSCDANISALSAGIARPGEAMLSYGSVGAAYICIDRPVTHPGLYFGHYVRDGYWVSVIAMQSVGAIVKWFRDQFCEREKEIAKERGRDAYELLDSEAEKVPPGSAGLIVLPYFMGERSPIMDPKARGMIFGLTLFHKKAHIYRAILEAFGYGLLHHIEILKEMKIKIDRWIAVNGGAKSRIWRQIVSDITGIPQHYASMHPGAPLGDAFLAGVGIGEIQDWEDIKKWIKITDVTHPNRERKYVYEKLYRIYCDLYVKLKRDMWMLADMSAAKP